MRIPEIRARIESGKYRVSFAHTEKLRKREVRAQDVEQAISTGEIVEDYPDDPRGLSCLILGFTGEGRPLHIVCGKIDDEVIIITAYEPNPEEWERDWKTRRG
jgi:hypothetical protein